MLTIGNNRDDFIRHKGKVRVFDDIEGEFVDVSFVDSVKPTAPVNAFEIKSPSGSTIYRGSEMGMSLECDLYHPGKNELLELLYRGIVTNTNYDGETAETDAEVAIAFFQAGGYFPLPGYTPLDDEGDPVPVTVSTVALASNPSETFTETTDYTVETDTLTGMSFLAHVTNGSIPVNTELIVTYSYTPGAGSILRPVQNGTQRDRFVVVDSLVDCDDLTKYRRYYLPHCFVVSEIIHQLLEVGPNNQTPNILPVRFEYAIPETCSKRSAFYWEDRVNPPAEESAQEGESGDT